MQTININNFKLYCEFLSQKDMSGGFLSPTSFNTALPFVLDKMIRKYYGVPEQYDKNDPKAAIGYEITQLVTDYIGHLKEDVMLPVNRNGRMTKPSNYLHKSSIAASFYRLEDITQAAGADEDEDCDTVQTTYKKKNNSKILYAWTPVTVVTDNEWASWTISSMRYPDKEYPICRFFKDYVEYLPLDIRTVRFIYIRYPQTPYWNYTNPSGTMPIYNPTGSTNIELPQICADEMAVTLLNRLGISIREEGLINWTNYTKQSGV